MLFVFTGDDRKRARAALGEAVAARASGYSVLRITDASAIEDVRAALQGGGLFAEARAVVFEYLSAREDALKLLEESLALLAVSSDPFFVLDEAFSAGRQRAWERHADLFKTFALPKSARKGTTVFALANALKKGDRRALWVALQRELRSGSAPEALLGVLFWGAKDLFLKSRPGSAERGRASRHIAALAELPHEARQRGVPLEYALERYLLGG